MKTQYALTPLALALTAVLSAAAYADGDVDSSSNGYGRHSGATAVIADSQISTGNHVVNKGTKNTATMQDSLKDAKGVLAVNVAGGDDNQQANATAMAVADAGFVFGTTALANIAVLQSGQGNKLHNYSTQNVAGLDKSVNDSTGHIAINLASGNFNQQKNDLAIANSETAYSATAAVNVTQNLAGNDTDNHATLTYGSAAVNLNLAANGSYTGTGNGSYSGSANGTTKGTSDQIGNVYLDSWSGPRHPGGTSTGHVDLDSGAQGAQDLNGDGGALAFNNSGTYSGSQSGSVGFNEAGTSTLAGSVSGYIPVVTGFNTPVINTATVSGSLNNASGAVGVNIAAGGGNQQSNSLAIARGCNACSGKTGL